MKPIIFNMPMMMKTRSKGGKRIMKLTVVFTGCEQVGIDTFVDYHETRVIEFTEEQKKLLTLPKDMKISNVIFEVEEGDQG